MLFFQHFHPINQLSISDDGTFIASCADDGFVCQLNFAYFFHSPQVYIYNLVDPEHGELINLSRPLKAVAIAPAYAKTRKVVTGETSVSQSVL